MKRISLILVVSLLLSILTVAPASATETEYSPNYVLEDFAESISDNILSQNAHSLKISYTETGAGPTKGAVYVTESGSYNTINYAFGARKGQTYDISAWIKMDETPVIPEVTFVIYSQPKDSSVTASIFNTTTVRNAGLEKDKWVKVSTVYTHNGTAHMSGDTTPYETLPIGRIQIRIGNGKASDTCASGKVSYTIDDVTVMPRESIRMPISEENLITNGDFETEAFSSDWTWNTGPTEVSEIQGANGTASATSITVKKDWGTIFQENVDIRFGRKYKVSYWAKAISDDAVGLEVYTILTRKDKKTDANVPDYEYLYNDDAVLSTEWKYYEAVYSNDLCTTDSVKPSFRFRVGKGTERVTFAVDEVKIEEIASEELLTSYVNIDGDYANGSIYGVAGASNGLVMGCIYRLFVPFGDDYAIVKSGNEKQNEFILPTAGNESYSTVIAKACAMDYDGNTGKEITKIYQKPDFNIRAVAEFNETVWNDKIPSLSACVTYSGADCKKTFFASLATYTKDGKLVRIDSEEITVTEGLSGTKNLTLTNDKDAVFAKVFLWENTTSAPVQTVASMEKETNGIYLYVDALAASGGDGSYASPFNNVADAVTATGGYAQSTGNNIYVICMPGEYYISETLNFPSTKFNGNNNITFTSYNRNDKARFTGGQKITGFELFDSTKNIYRAKTPSGITSRQLYVNGVRAEKARSESGLTDAYNIRKLSDGTYITADEYTALKEADPSASASAVGIRTTDTFLKDYKRINDIELVFYEQWTNPRCQVSSITDNGDGTILLVMDQRGWTYMSNKSSTSVTVPVYIENALELLDSEGEWYHDSVDGYVYYKPRFFENIKSAEVVMPVTEKLITVSGTENRIAKNLLFDSLEFTETTWMRPSTTTGHSDAQNNHLRERPDVSIDVLPDATIEVNFADNVDFTNCSFNRMGTTALKMTGGIKNCDVVGNEFYELSAGGINLGEPAGEMSKVINPTDQKYIITNNNITDNYIHKYGIDYMSAAGISAGFVENTNILRNEIFDSPYSGMHIGYGWANYDSTGTATKNLHIKNNYIHNVLNHQLFDGGAIYLNGATGGTTQNPNLICENYIEDQGNYPGAIYPDEGSCFWEISNNVVDLSMHNEWTGKFGSVHKAPSWLHIWTSSIHDIVVKNNYSTTNVHKNAGKRITFEDALLPDGNGWQDEALRIIADSGISEDKKMNFKYGLQKATVPEEITLKIGESIPNKPLCYTSKKTPYYPSGVDMYEKVQNSDIAETNNFVITAKSVGETTVNYYLVENGIIVEAQTKIIVTE